MANTRSRAAGNGSAVVPRSPKVQAAEPRENIFLFYPNLIGKITPIFVRRAWDSLD
jgi:hypothetical protein